MPQLASGMRRQMEDDDKGPLDQNINHLESAIQMEIDDQNQQGIS